MKVGITLDSAPGDENAGSWLGSIAERVRWAEAAGYDYVTASEQSHDPVLSMTLAAAASSRLELQTAVSIAFPRSPFVLAMQAWDVQALSAGRFTLGLGSQVRAHNERRFSTPWVGGAATRLKEYVRCLHAVWHTFQTNERPNFAGEFYQFKLITPHFNPGPIDYPRPGVAMAVVGAAMARAAGDVADCVLPHGFTTQQYLRDVTLPNVATGLKRSGRDWSDIEISAGGFMVLGEDEAEIEQKLEPMRETVAYYGSTPSYQDVFAHHGWAELGERLHTLSRVQKWDEMTKLVPDDVLRTFVGTSTYDGLPKFLREQREYADKVVLRIPAESAKDRDRLKHLIGEINAIAPDRSAIEPAKV